MVFNPEAQIRAILALEKDLFEYLRLFQRKKRHFPALLDITNVKHLSRIRQSTAELNRDIIAEEKDEINLRKELAPLLAFNLNKQQRSLIYRLVQLLSELEAQLHFQRRELSRELRVKKSELVEEMRKLTGSIEEEAVIVKQILNVTALLRRIELSEKRELSTFARILSDYEFNLLGATHRLGVLRPKGEYIPAMRVDSASVEKKLMGASKKQLKAVYTNLGGRMVEKGGYHLVLFRTHEVPVVESLASRATEFQECKFRSGTEIEILETKRV